VAPHALFATETGQKWRKALNDVNEGAFFSRNACKFSKTALTLQRVFHGIDLRLTGLVVGRQSIFFVPRCKHASQTSDTTYTIHKLLRNNFCN
jgi:hypothetical protein